MPRNTTQDGRAPDPHHLILVREVDQQMSGSGCCGRLEGDLIQWDESGCIFPERRTRMEEIGGIYRAVRRAFGEAVEITMVDPRNQISLVSLLVRDAFRYGNGPRDVLRALMSSSLSTGIFDGEVVFAGEIPAGEAVVEELRERMAGSRY